MRAYLESLDEESGKQRFELLAEKLVEEALSGKSATLLGQILARVDGPIPQRIPVGQLSNEQILSFLAFGGAIGGTGGAEDGGAEAGVDLV